MTEEELRKEKERLINADIKSYENRARHVFNQGYELGYQQRDKDFIKKEEKAYQKGLEDGKQVGYDKGYEDGARCQDEVQYQKGLDDAWATARKLFSDMSEKEIEAIFPNEWNNGGFRALIELKPQEAIEKIREYEEKQKQEEAKERFREKLESGYFSGKQNQICDTCIHNGKEWHSEPCDGCTLSDSHYVSASDPIESEKTVFPDSPCDLCVYNPPSSFDGKPCTMCPAERNMEE